MKPRILVIQFRTNLSSKKQEQIAIRREAGTYTDIDFIDALNKKINYNLPETILSTYNGVILGGSGDLDFDGNRKKNDKICCVSYELLQRLRPFLTYIFKNDIPTLGICFGHQILGAFSGAKVTYDEKQRKTCSHKVKIIVDKESYFIFEGLPDSFYAHYGHKDVLAKIPKGATLLMHGGARCKVSALKYKKNIYTVQFHPELTYTDMVTRINNSPGYLPEGVQANELFKDVQDSNLILRNFSKWVSTYKNHYYMKINNISEKLPVELQKK